MSLTPLAGNNVHRLTLPGPRPPTADERAARRNLQDRHNLNLRERRLQEERESFEAERAAFEADKQSLSAERIAGAEERFTDIGRAINHRNMTESPQALAAAIIRAGQRRRAEIPDDGPAPGSLAAEILRCGRVRRGELANDADMPPLGSLARQIVDAGRRRRGEISE